MWSYSGLFLKTYPRIIEESHLPDMNIKVELLQWQIYSKKFQNKFKNIRTKILVSVTSLWTDKQALYSKFLG